MTIRRFKESDIARSRIIAERSGLPYPDLSKDSQQIESIIVIADDEDKPLMIGAAKRLVEVYLWCEEMHSPLAKLHCLRLLHEAMGAELRRLGYESAEAFPPPSIAKKFGRRLERTFGWVRNWQSWSHHL